MNYREDLSIDPEALDVELLRLPNLAMKYGKHFAECKKLLSQAEERIKVTRAELIAKANINPLKCCKKEKPNAADIEAFYRTHPDHIHAKEEWIEAQYELQMAEIAYGEFHYTKTEALKNLVKLQGQGYNAGPDEPRALSFEWERFNRNEQANRAVKSKMKRNN